MKLRFSDLQPRAYLESLPGYANDQNLGLRADLSWRPLGTTAPEPGPAGVPIHIRADGSGTYNNALFGDDALYTTEQYADTRYATSAAITNTAYPAFYQTGLNLGVIKYRFEVPNGEYTAHFHFLAIDTNAIFSLNVNGSNYPVKRLVSELSSGATYAAGVLSGDMMAQYGNSVTNGAMEISITSNIHDEDGTKSNVIFCGLEIVTLRQPSVLVI